MASLLILGLTLIAASATAAQTRIVGGNAVRIEQHPSLVQVEALSGNAWNFHCGGTILNAFSILSAAQCFYGSDYSPQFRRIRAGTAIRQSGGVIRYVVREINHPSFGKNGYDGDISVIRIFDGLNIVHPVLNTMRSSPIVAYNSNFQTGTVMNKVGWGFTSTYSGLSPELRAVSVRTTDHNTCVQSYARVPNAPPVTNNMICATAPGGDACTGDQGGPLFLFHNILVGVISWSNGCAVNGFPGISTRIASYSFWIQAAMAS